MAARPGNSWPPEQRMPDERKSRHCISKDQKTRYSHALAWVFSKRFCHRLSRFESIFSHANLSAVHQSGIVVIPAHCSSLSLSRTIRQTTVRRLRVRPPLETTLLKSTLVTWLRLLLTRLLFKSIAFCNNAQPSGDLLLNLATICQALFAA